MNGSTNVLAIAGDISLFGLRAVTDAFRRPFEVAQIRRQLAEVGSKSLPLIVASGFALGAVLTLHTRGTLVTFGATAWIPTVQALAFFVEIGPLVTGLLVAGRVGSGIGAVLSNMRATEQIDAIESLSVDSFKFLVVPRIVACTLALPLLTLFLDFSALLGGFVSEYAASRLSFQLYISRAFSAFDWSNFYPPTLKTAVFGFAIGTISSFLGYTTDEGADGVGRAATRGVVISSLVIIVLDVLLIKFIFFIFPETRTMRGGAAPAVVLQQVSKSFGEKPILRDVSFQVRAGEALCILGRSGTGKSVTLKLIISLLKPEQGQIWIEGEEITGLHASDLSRVRRKMGFLFQGAALFDSLTLYENLALPLLRLTSKSPAQVEVIIDRVLREVGLADDKQKMPSELSGGMRKRAGLARALVLEPRILLVDEPSSGLDRITASEIDELLLREKVEHRTTLIVVTHDVRGARRLADRIAVLNQGRLIADGTVEEVQHSENEIARSLMSE